MADKDTIQMIRKDITERLRDRDNHDCIEAANEIERLRRERDEARREVCRDEAYRPSPSPPCTANQVADRRGWDCFKENTDGSK